MAAWMADEELKRMKTMFKFCLPYPAYLTKFKRMVDKS